MIINAIFFFYFPQILLKIKRIKINTFYNFQIRTESFLEGFGRHIQTIKLGLSRKRKK